MNRQQRARVWQKPLDTRSREIRLLILEPNEEREERLSARLEIVSLDRKPRYDAISHAWGGPQRSCSLYLDSIRLPITESLHSCLQELRSTQTRQIFWVDAICIDQFDMEERAQQVQMMEHIFNDAMTVFAWLGDVRTDSMPGVFETLRFIEKLYCKKDRFDFNTEQQRKLCLFTKSAWFRRLWTKQEAALAKRLEFAHRGCRVSMETVKACHRYLNAPGRRHARLRSLDDADDREDLSNMFAQLDDLDFLQSLLGQMTHGSLSAKSLQTVQLLFICRSAGCSDLRDRLFGLIGIFTASFKNELVFADYSNTPQQVYTEFARNFIKETKSLMLLTQASQDHNSLVGLPSWVPDWSSYYDFQAENIRFSNYSKFYNASEGVGFSTPLRYQTAYEDRRDLIGLKGCIWASVEEVGRLCHDATARVKIGENDHLSLLSDCLQKWQRRYMRLVANRSVEDDKFQRTMFRGLTLPNDFPRPFEDLHRRAAEGLNDLPGPLSHETELMVRSVDNCRFFVTNWGDPGLGPPGANEGDLVAVLAGGTLPFILRKSQQKIEAIEGTETLYKLVGECYVDGLEKGQCAKRRGEAAFETIWLK